MNQTGAEFCDISFVVLLNDKTIPLDRFGSNVKRVGWAKGPFHIFENAEKSASQELRKNQERERRGEKRENPR